MPTSAQILAVNSFNEANTTLIDWGNPWGLPGAGRPRFEVEFDDFPFLSFGPGNIVVSVCNIVATPFNPYTDDGTGFGRGFTLEDRLLIARHERPALPIAAVARNHKCAIHLHFNPGVTAVGARISADGDIGLKFQARIEIENPVNGARFPVTLNSKFTELPNLAPFIGVRGGVGELIEDAWFDVDYVDPDQSLPLGWVAMNQLLILP